VDVGDLAAAERAAGTAGASVGHWWRDLVNAAESALTTQSLDTLLGDAMAAMRAALEVDTVALLVANEAGDELVARAASGLGEELAVGLGIRAGEGMSGLVLATRRPLVVDDLSAIAVASATLRDSGLRSVVAAPVLSADGHPLGVLWIGSYDLARFGGDDGEVLQLVADRLAAALDRVRLFETEREARERAEKLADRLGRMQQATARLATVQTVDDATGALARLLVPEPSAAGPCWAGVWLLHGDRLEPVSAAANTGPAPTLAAVAADKSTPLGVACRSGRAGWWEGPDRPADCLPVDQGTGGVAVLPIGDGVGAAAVVFAEPHRFSAGEREFLTAVTGQGALAVDRARLLARQVQLADMSSFLARAAKVLSEADDLADTLERLAALALPALGEICLIDVIGEDGSLSRMVAKHHDPARQALVDRLRLQYPPDPDGTHPAVDAVRTRRTRWSDRMSDTFLRATTRDDDHYALTKALGFRSFIAVPLVTDGQVLGSVTLVSAERPFGVDDVAFAERLAEQVAAVVGNARRYDEASRTSRILQSSLLPRRLPEVSGLTVDTRYLAAAEGLEVGGDFYDLVGLPSGRVGFTIGDVAGHDRDAAALMGHLRSATRALAAQVSGPGELVAALKWSWDLLDFDRLATAVFGHLDPATGETVMASAGHYPPLLVDAGTARYLPVVPAAPLGVDGGPPMVEWRGTLAAGQSLLLYTDGAVDERHAGPDRSMEALAEVAAAGDPDPAALCDRLVRWLPADRVDDVALMALYLTPAAAHQPADSAGDPAEQRSTSL